MYKRWIWNCHEMNKHPNYTVYIYIFVENIRKYWGEICIAMQKITCNPRESVIDCPY